MRTQEELDKVYEKALDTAVLTVDEDIYNPVEYKIAIKNFVEGYLHALGFEAE